MKFKVRKQSPSHCIGQRSRYASSLAQSAAVGCGCHGLDLHMKHMVSKDHVSYLYKKARACVNAIKKSPEGPF